jgi:hypothetical protein
MDRLATVEDAALSMSQYQLAADPDEVDLQLAQELIHWIIGNRAGDMQSASGVRWLLRTSPRPTWCSDEASQRVRMSIHRETMLRSGFGLGLLITSPRPTLSSDEPSQCVVLMSEHSP